MLLKRFSFKVIYKTFNEFKDVKPLYTEGDEIGCSKALYELAGKRQLNSYEIIYEVKGSGNKIIR